MKKSANDSAKTEIDQHNLKPTQREKEKETEQDSNGIIFIQIITERDQIESFLINHNTDKAFHSKFSTRIFGIKQEVKGFKNLKILIALSPIKWLPCIKVSYDSKSPDALPIENILKEYFDTAYNTSIEDFTENFNQESQQVDCPLTSDSIFLKRSTLAFAGEKHLIYKAILKVEDDDLLQNMYFQAVIPFFIECASRIPVDEDFWEYFLLYGINPNHNDGNQPKFILYGLCSLKRFHIDLNSHRAMISQFLILPPFQRRGLGMLMLDLIYDDCIKNNQCFDISTEDPAFEFISLRDAVLFKKLLSELEIFKLNTANEYRKSNISVGKLKEQISQKFKISLVIAERYILMYKYFSIEPKGDEVEDLLNADLYDYIVRLNKDEFIQNNDRVPCIEFHDEEEFNCLEILQENEENQLPPEILAKKLEILLGDLLEEFKIVEFKCRKNLRDLK